MVVQWSPTIGAAWQWQLTGKLDRSVNVPVYDVDGFAVSALEVADLHAAHRHVICYLSVGAWENWRPDAANFPTSVLGKDNGWPGERWLDIRRLDILGPLIAKRMEMCRAKGFDAVEPDNVDGFENDTGFPLTASHQLAFNRLVASLAHSRGLKVALKNDLSQVPDLVESFDFAVNEQCMEFGECDELLPFLRAGKAVLHVEYNQAPSTFCPNVPRGFSSMRKHLNLDTWRQPCP